MLCAGPVRDSKVATAGAGEYYDSPRYEEYAKSEYYGHGGPYHWQQEGGLEGAHVWGGLYFNTQTEYGECRAEHHLAAGPGLRQLVMR